MKPGHVILFVYGTLMKGFGNHHCIAAGEFLGPAQVPGMLYVNGLPYARYDGGMLDQMMSFIQGELYLVDEVTLRRCDRLEGYTPGMKQNPDWYYRLQVDTKDGYPVFMYHVEAPPKHAEYIPTGSYRVYRDEQYPKASRGS